MARLRYNGMATGSAGSLADISLSGSHTNSTTTLTFNAALTYANGTAVPTLSGGDYFMLSILDSGGRVSEIVKVTAYTSGATSATVVRGQEGTSGVSHASGDKVVHAGTVTDHAVRVPLARAKRTTTLSVTASSSWAALDTGLDVTVPAVAGDVIEVAIAGRVYMAANNSYFVIDAQTLVSGSSVNSVSADGAPSTSTSMPGWAFGNVNTTYIYLLGAKAYTVQSGDISSGSVTLRLFYRCGANVSFDGGNDPYIYVSLKNLGQIT